MASTPYVASVNADALSASRGVTLSQRVINKHFGRLATRTTNQVDDDDDGNDYDGNDDDDDDDNDDNVVKIFLKTAKQ